MGQGRESEKQKQDNLMGHTKDSLISEREERKKKQVMQRQSLTTSHHQMAHPISEIQIFWKSSPNVLLLSMASYDMEHFPYVVQNILLTSLGPLS